jgi:hypothetical protein
MTPQVNVLTLAFDEAMPGFDDGAVADFVGSIMDDPARTPWDTTQLAAVYPFGCCGVCQRTGVIVQAPSEVGAGPLPRPGENDQPRLCRFLECVVISCIWV